MAQARKLDEDADALDTLDERAYEHVVDFVAAAALKDLERGREFALGMAKALARMPARPSSRTPTPTPLNDGAAEAAPGKDESCPPEAQSTATPATETVAESSEELARAEREGEEMADRLYAMPPARHAARR